MARIICFLNLFVICCFTSQSFASDSYFAFDSDECKIRTWSFVEDEAGKGFKGSISAQCTHEAIRSTKQIESIYEKIKKDFNSLLYSTKEVKKEINGSSWSGFFERYYIGAVEREVLISESNQGLTFEKKKRVPYLSTEKILLGIKNKRWFFELSKENDKEARILFRILFTSEKPDLAPKDKYEELLKSHMENEFESWVQLLNDANIFDSDAWLE